MNEIEKKLFDAINNILSNIPLKELKTISSNLSKKYQKQKQKYFASDEERLVYIACRMPATFKALVYVLEEARTIQPNISLTSVLDLGSGPGTAAWAFLSVFKRLKKIHLVEKDAKIVSLGKELLDRQSFEKKITYEKNDLLKIKNYDFDIVTLSYVANELRNPFIEKIINRWFYSKSKVIVFLEPGTMYGFKKIKFIRKKLIDKGVNIIAPCPNKLNCPMSKNDWCHFYTRVQRSKYHKYLKAGTLAYEDEKFSYVIASKEKVISPKSRVLRFPKKNLKEICLTLCMDGRVKKEKILKKDTKRYKRAKKINWGDIFDV